MVTSHFPWRLLTWVCKVVLPLTLWFGWPVWSLYGLPDSYYPSQRNSWVTTPNMTDYCTRTHVATAQRVQSPSRPVDDLFSAKRSNSGRNVSFIPCNSRKNLCVCSCPCGSVPCALMQVWLFMYIYLCLYAHIGKKMPQGTVVCRPCHELSLSVAPPQSCGSALKSHIFPGQTHDLFAPVKWPAFVSTHLIPVFETRWRFLLEMTQKRRLVFWIVASKR